MQPTIQTSPEKKLIGHCLSMSFADNKTVELWRGFMPRRKEITNHLNADLISMQVYGADFSFKNFNPQVPFDRWAAVEVADFDTVPDGMQTFVLPQGLYAVFHYQGLNTDTKIFEYIFGTWLPASDYILDSRPHFEVMGEKYKNNDPTSEEEIWIPVKPKA